MILAGLAGLAVFIWYEFRSPSPVLSMSLFVGNRGFLFSNLAALINYSATFAVTFLMSLYFQYARGFSPALAGFALVPQFLLQMLVSPYAGRLSDRVEPRIIASIGMGVTVLGLALLTILSEATPLWYIIACLVLLGLGFGLFSSPNTNAIMSAVDRRYYGVASGMNGTMRLLGQMLSMGIATTIFAVVIGQCRDHAGVLRRVRQQRPDRVRRLHVPLPYRRRRLARARHHPLIHRTGRSDAVRAGGGATAGSPCSRFHPSVVVRRRSARSRESWTYRMFSISFGSDIRLSISAGSTSSVRSWIHQKFPHGSRIRPTFSPKKSGVTSVTTVAPLSCARLTVVSASCTYTLRKLGVSGQPSLRSKSMMTESPSCTST